MRRGMGDVGGGVVRHVDSVIGGEADGLAVVGGLRDMMGKVRRDDAGDARRGGYVSPLCAIGQ